MYFSIPRNTAPPTTPSTTLTTAGAETEITGLSACALAVIVAGTDIAAAGLSGGALAVCETLNTSGGDRQQLGL